MSHWKSLLAATATLMLASTSSVAAVTGNVTVTKILVETTFGGGDIAFEVSTPIAGCAQGFWLSSANVGFKNAYAALLAAFHTQSSLLVYASTDPADRWTGSSSVYCRVTTIVPVL